MSHHVGRAFAVHWSEVERWSTDSFRSVTWSWPESTLCRLGDVLERRVVELADRSDLRNVPIIEKISFGGVICVTEPDDREDYRGRLFWAEVGDLIYSKIRAKQGSLGIILPEVGRLAVSAEYPVYTPVPAKVVPDYLTLLLKCSSFLRFLDGIASGGDTKTRISPELFESLQVALPPLATQQAIVDYWKATQKKNAAVLKAANERELAVTIELSKALGLGEIAAPITRKAFAASWSQLQRWSLQHLRQSLMNVGGGEQTHPVVTLGEVVSDLENGWSPKCHPRPAEGDEWGVLKLGAVSFGQYNESENKALPRELKPVPALEISAGDVLISRANITRLVGACAYVASTRPQLLLCDKIFRVVPQKHPRILPEFLAEVMKLPYVRQQIESLATGSSPTMKNITKPSLLSLRFPLPPLAIQKQLVNEVTCTREKVAAERTAAAKLADDTAREVEGMILGHRPIQSPN
jgi:type I restriction enzyme S subunit